MLHNNVAPNIGQKLSNYQWPIILGAGLYSTCRGERVALVVVIRLNATFLPLRPYCKKMCTSFLNDAESLTTYGCALWCSQQGRNEVRWRLGQETSLAPPCSNLRSFGNKSAAGESTCNIVRTFRRPGNCGPLGSLAPHVTPLAVRLFTFVHILWTLQPHFTLRLSARTLQCLFESVWQWCSRLLKTCLL